MVWRLDRFVPSQSRPLMTALEREIETGRWMFTCQAKRASELGNNTRHDKERGKKKSSKCSDVIAWAYTSLPITVLSCHLMESSRMTWVGFCDVTKLKYEKQEVCWYVSLDTSLPLAQLSRSRTQNGQLYSSMFAPFGDGQERSVCCFSVIRCYT